MIYATFEKRGINVVQNSIMLGGKRLFFKSHVWSMKKILLDMY